MSITTNASHTPDIEVEGNGGEAGSGEERDEKRSETAVDMKRQRSFLSKGKARE